MLKKILIVLTLTSGSTAYAASFDTLEGLVSDQFKTFTENLGAATHYKGITPAESLGIIGIDIGLGLSSTQIDEDIFDAASNGDFDLSSFLLPRLTVQKGLPFGIDIGASLSAAPNTDVKLIGAELRYAIIDGNVAVPAVGLRASFSTVQGVNELDLNNAALELLVSKGLLLLTPYAGVGIVRTTATANDVDSLSEETVDQNKLFVGLNINFGFNVALEADRTGEYTSYSAKAGIRF